MSSQEEEQEHTRQSGFRDLLPVSNTTESTTVGRPSASATGIGKSGTLPAGREDSRLLEGQVQARFGRMKMSLPHDEVDSV
jgi:hypothetical protein